MRYELYIDVLFATSFCLDFEALFFSALLLKKDVKIARLCGMALLATLCSVILFLWMNNYRFYMGVLCVLIHPLLVSGTFRAKGVRMLLRDISVVYLVYVILGGLMDWVCMSLFAGKHRMGAILLVSGLGIAAAGYLKWRFSVGMQILTVHLFIGERELVMSAYHDTGNLLEDPYTHRPVHIVADGKIHSFLQEAGKCPRLIPYKSLGQTEGLLEIYTLDKLVIDRRRKKILIESPVIGVTADTLFSGNSYQMILNNRLQE